VVELALDGGKVIKNIALATIQTLEKYYNCFIVYVVGHYAYVMVSKALNNKWQLSCWMKLI
jgi:hypothetical protein